MTAEDLSYPFKSSTATVIINVIRNSNTPTFTTANYDVSVSEDKPVLEEILTVSAVDNDSGINGQVSYSINNVSDIRSIFGINPLTGVIFARVSLLEVIEDTYQVQP